MKAVSAQDQTGFATGWVPPAGGEAGGCRGGRRLCGGVFLLRGFFDVVLFMVILIVVGLTVARNSIIIDDGRLAPSERSRRFSTQNPRRFSSWWVVPSMSVRVVRFSKDTGGHLVFAHRLLFLCSKGNIRGSSRRTQNPGTVFGTGLHALKGGRRGHVERLMSSLNGVKNLQLD